MKRGILVVVVLFLFAIFAYAENTVPDVDDLEIEDMKITGLGDQLETEVRISSRDTNRDRPPDDDWWLRASIDKKTAGILYQVYFYSLTPSSNTYTRARYKSGDVLKEQPIHYFGTTTEQIYYRVLPYGNYGMDVSLETLESWKTNPPTIRLFSDTSDSRKDFELNGEEIAHFLKQIDIVAAAMKTGKWK